MVIATEELPGLDMLRDERGRLRAVLARLRRRLGLQSTLEGVAEAVAAIVAVGAVLVFVDWWFRLGTPVRRVVLPACLLGLAGVLGSRAWRRWRAARLDELSLAMTLDRFRPGTGQWIADVLQLPDLLGEDGGGASPAMVRLAVRRASEALAASDWQSLWNRRRTIGRLGLLIGCLIVSVLFGLIAPEAARLSGARWLLGSSERWPQRTYLSVVGLGESGRLVAPKGEPFAVEVRSDLPDLREGTRRRGDWIVGGRGERLIVRSGEGRPRSVAPDAVTIRERIAGRGRRDGAMVKESPGRFRFELPPASSSSTLELTGGDDWLGPVAIERRERPTLGGVAVRVREPGASYEGMRVVEQGAQNLVFLPDTEMEVTLTGSEPVAELKLDARPNAAPEPSRVDPRTFRASWTLREATTLEVRLTSADSGLESRPSFLSLGLLKDRAPRVTLRAVGVGARVTPVATIPLDVAATDDLGLASLRLHVDRAAPSAEDDAAPPAAVRQTIDIPLASDRALDHQARHDVELSSDPPAVGTLLKLVAEAEDRCARGAQSGRSGVVQIQVVSPDELFYDILVRQRAERAKFLAALEAAEKQGPALDGAPSRDAYVGAMRVVHSGSRQLDQIAGRIADTLQEMKLNQIGSPKSHRLLQEGVIEPILALNAGTMTELRGVLQSLGGGAPRAGADAESARRLHGDVVTSMRRILDQMSQWESFVDVVNQVAEVIEMEQGVLKATQQARESRTEEVFDANP